MSTPPGPGDPAPEHPPSAGPKSEPSLDKDGLLAPASRDNLGRPTLKGIAILRKIGQGGMGAVYHGKHPRLGIEVAVKVLPFHLADTNPQAVDYFLREARVAARLNHPNLVRVFDVDTDGCIYFLVMEYVQGMTAGSLMRERLKGGLGPMAETDALDLMGVICDGLAAAHGENMVHRDIKPDNIIVPLDENGRPEFRKAKLMDLGLAKDAGGSTDLTASNIAMGTPGYMSPEQAEDARGAGPPADVFSMGATLYALLTGTAPFAGTTILNILRRTAGEAHKPVREINPAVTERTAGVVDRCLAKAPKERYPNAAALREAMRECREALGGASPAAPAAPPAPTRRRSAAPLVIGCLAVFLVGALVAGVAGWRWLSRRAKPAPTADAGGTPKNEPAPEDSKPAPEQDLGKRFDELIEADEEEAARELIERMPSQSRGGLRRRLEALVRWKADMAEGRKAEDAGRWKEASEAYGRAAQTEHPRRARTAREAQQRAAARAEKPVKPADPDPVKPPKGDPSVDSARDRLAEAMAALKAGRRQEAVELARKAAAADPSAPGLARLEEDLWPELLVEEARSKEGPTDEMLLSADGSVLYAAGAGYGGVAAWRTGGLDPVAVPARGGQRPHSLTLAPQHRKLFALIGDPESKRRFEIAAYDADKPSAPEFPSIELFGQKNRVSASRLALSPDGPALIRSLFATGGRDGTDYYALDVIAFTGERIRDIGIARAQTHALIAIAPDGGSMATGGGAYSTYKPVTGELDEKNRIDPAVYLWVDRREKLAMPYDEAAGEVKCLRYTPDGRRVLAGTSGGRVLVFDVGSRKLEASADVGGSVRGLATDGVRIAAVAGEKLRIVSPAGSVVGDVPGGRVRAAEFAPDGKALFIGDAEGRIRKLVFRALGKR